ncbi:MAG TPA: hypothetical protein VG308_06425, partial [Stellaceae bacterium]|nr:hypothetical protein [Stellaceae bacterium]
AKRPAKPAAPSAKKKGGIRPLLLALGLGLFWFVEYQDTSGASDVPMWGDVMVVGVRLLADFVGAWVLISTFQLSVGLAKLGLTYLRGLWLQESRG